MSQTGPCLIEYFAGKWEGKAWRVGLQRMLGANTHKENIDQNEYKRSRTVNHAALA
jgi:hypothetical protein